MGRAETAIDQLPPGFPATVPVVRQRCRNWSGEVVTEPLWTARPATAEDVLSLVHWAHGAGWTVRPRGRQHNWAPFTVAPGTASGAEVLLVDMTDLDGLSLRAGTPVAVRAGAGASMEALLGFLHERGHGLVSVPAVGDVTVAGVLAIGGHGAALPAAQEVPAPGEAFGTVSNLVLECTAVVWDGDRGDHVLRTFTRRDPELAHLLVHLGRALLTEVVLQVGPARQLRCESTVRVPAERVFAAPDEAGEESFGALLERSGRVESILFPFTGSPWTKTWTVSAEQPRRSRRTTGPYPFTFSDRFPEVVVDRLARRLARWPALTPWFGRVQRAAVALGLPAVRGRDLWGPAHHTQLYVRPTTFRYAELGLVVLARRDDVQWVVHEVATAYQQHLADHHAAGRHPINGPLELRVSGLDRPEEVLMAGAEPPSLSPVHPRPDHPDWEAAVWVNVLTAPGTAGAAAAFADLEAWARRTFDGTRAALRVEWSKGWAHGGAGAWTDREALHHDIPGSHRAGRAPGGSWDDAVATFDALDPHRRFTSPLLGRLVGAPAVRAGRARGLSR